MKKIIVTEEMTQSIGGSRTCNIRTRTTYLLFGFIPVFQSKEELIQITPS
jgi:hypothetical protein